eukprot:755361-Hanusia_phi.AAC.1
MSGVRWDFLCSKQGLEEMEKLFSAETALVPSSSSSFHEFQEFFERYCKHRQREVQQEKEKRIRDPPQPFPCKSAQVKNNLLSFLDQLPSSYDQRYRINFSVVVQHRSRTGLTDEEVKEMKRGLIMFEDFRQRKTLNKIKKMKEGQRDLPIYAFKDQIVSAVKNNQ